MFLSHKRSDAKDFARALYNLLVLRGVSTFLDFEYRQDGSCLQREVPVCLFYNAHCGHLAHQLLVSWSACMFHGTTNPALVSLCREELANLGDVVAKCKNLVFIL